MGTLKKIVKFLFSMPFMGVLVIFLAFCMAMATFIENRSGTMAAQAVVYQAWWFELSVLLVFINILANMIRLKLYNLKRLPIFLFHLAFLVVIAGAALTRFVGTEGIMHIREGETTASYITSDTYFYVKAENRSGNVEKYQKIFISPVSKKQVNVAFRLGEDRIRINSIEYVSGESMKMGSQMAGGVSHADVMQIKVTVNNGSEEVVIRGIQRNGFISNQFEISGIKFTASFGSKPMELPFTLTLNDFQLDKYPGSMSPSSFASEVTLTDPSEKTHKPYRIFMNNILSHKGYRFFQSSFDNDEQGTVLSVNHDALGSGITYVGYFLMFACIILSFFAPGSRFKKLLGESRKSAAVAGLLLLMILLPGFRASAQNFPTPPNADEAKAFGKIWMQGNEGRMKPVNTLSSEMLRKMFGKNAIGGMTPEQFWLSLLTQPQEWAGLKMFEIKEREIANMFKISGGKGSYNDFFTQDKYLMGDLVNEALQKQPNQRNGLDKYVIKLDETLNVFYMGMTGQLLQIFPDPRDQKAKWSVPGQVPEGVSTLDSLMITGAFVVYLKAVASGDLAQAKIYREGISRYQKTYGSSLIPSANKANLEVFYNRALIFERLTVFYALIGLLFLFVQIWSLFKPAKWHKSSAWIFGGLLFVAWIIHTFGLGLRWYLSGHAPMSNGYESMIFVAWGTLLAGFLVVKRSRLPLALTGVLAALSLLVAHLSWMNPEITPLVPVLKSVWLTIHVAIIMTSYSFLGLGALIGLITMVLYISKTKKNHVSLNGHIQHLTRLNQIVLIVGLYLITIGCFLGAIWANQSWGRYWGWDPKETWCLITILVYSFITHMHSIKDFDNDFAFNLGSVLGFGAVLMTYFGVNYFLGGMHSYAGGEAPAVPVIAYVILIALIGLVYVAYFNKLRYQPRKK
ncbi:MAG: cytochrome C biogenesis protein [Porphyromonadaceae bacterium]|nr:MAG: cytochrome C biogenesis protein [Porphyromonadaceae bacterium]